MAVAAFALAVLTVAGTLIFGLGILAVFAVGAGHISLNEIKAKQESGRVLALVALGVGYGLAIWALISTLILMQALVV